MRKEAESEKTSGSGLEKRIIQKLKSSSGESISEVLAASIVIALGMILLVSMLTAAQKLVQTSETLFLRNTARRDAVEMAAAGAAQGEERPAAGVQSVTLTGKNGSTETAYIDNSRTGTVQVTGTITDGLGADTYFDYVIGSKNMSLSVTFPVAYPEGESADSYPAFTYYAEDTAESSDGN